MNNQQGRRPLKIREFKITATITCWLNNRQISPNSISICSTVFALLCCICLISVALDATIWLTWLAALFIQLRLLCNLFDGMVAIEGGKSTASGELFNDIPDRIADPLILVPVGYILSEFSWGTELGWLAGLLAITTAYVRTLASSIGAPTLFTGPMAKQHRMALLTIALLLTPVEYLFFRTSNILLLIVLSVICIGSLLTVYVRVRDAYIFLESPKNKDANHV